MSDEFEPAISEAADLGKAIISEDVSPTVAPKTHRSMSDNTRKLFQNIVEHHKGEPGEQLEVDELVPVTHETSVAAAGATAVDPAKPAPSTPPAAAAPAPDLAAKAITQQEKLVAEMHSKALEEREAKLLEREKALPTRERYLEKSGETLRDLIKEWTGATSDGDLRDALTDAITELTESLGVPVDPAIKREVESRKALRTVKAYKTDLTKQQEKINQDRVAAEVAQREHHAIGAIAFALNQEPHKYPHLMAEDNPEQSVWKAIKFKHEKEGVALPWEEAAALAEKFYATQEAAKSAKRSRLLNPAATAAPVKAGATQGVSPQNRQAPSAPTTTTSAATEAAAQSEPVDEDARRRRSLGKILPRLKESSP